MKKLILAFAVLFFTAVSVSAQTRSCGTMNHLQSLQAQDPHLQVRMQQIEQFTQQWLSNPANQNAPRAVITIPVVVHVVYNTASQNISNAQVQSQIDVLNADFHKLNADLSKVPAPWTSLVADCNIQFCLAQRDPNGNATTGIVRKSTTTTSFIDDDKVKKASTGGDDAWPATSYLNLWSCNLGGGLLGYAQFPGGPAATDGVVILCTAFGTTGTAAAPYNLGRTATHEIGHWLNLYHIWGDDNGACSGSDLVGDTPNQANSNGGCPSYPKTDACTASSPGVMFMNYMDYVNDACMYMFTNGQYARMSPLFASGGSRASLLNSQGCVPVNGAPVPAFTGTPTSICAGQTVTYTSQSTGTVTSYAWSFPGGTPATSTAASPVVTYNTAGTYNASLTVTNSFGSNPLVKTNYITVQSSQSLPISQGFESTTFPPTNWSIGNPDGNATWKRTTSASGYGASTASAYFDNFNSNYVGAKDYIYTPVVNFTGVTTGRIKFDYAYALDNSNSAFDTLQLLYSTDCGKTWTSLWKKGGSQLTTTATKYNSVFNPTATQWKTDSINLPSSLSTQNSVQFEFVNICDYGNTILLDNINIYNAVTVCAKPVVSFFATPTTVNTGGTVSFTDQSTNTSFTPTTWSWTFTGGTPATSTLQNPSVVYSTNGTYAVKLKVTNACGTDSLTKTAYINVITSTGGSSCDTFSNLVNLYLAGGDSARLYGDGANGFLAGTNQYQDLAKADKFTNSFPGRKLTGARFLFAYAKASNSATQIKVNVWDANGPNGGPGAILGTQNVLLTTIVGNTTPSVKFTDVSFPSPVVVGANFFVGFDLPTTAGDTLAIATSSQFKSASHSHQGWEKSANGTWYPYDTANISWGKAFSNFIFPTMCSVATPPVAAFTASKTTICVGDTVTFTDQSTNSPNSWSWFFQGGNPSSSASQNPKVVYNTAGVDSVRLTVSNADGSNSLTKTLYITVKGLPSATTTVLPVKCFGGADGSASVNVTGGTPSYAYAWSGGGAGATISSKPAGTYTVSITDNSGCKTTASANISQPFSTLSFTTNSSSAYCGNSNGLASISPSGGSGGFTYLWSNTKDSATIYNLAAATYSVTVKDVNLCSVTASVTVTAATAIPTVTINTTDATSCASNNGAAATSISGSSNGATYIWSNGAITGSVTSLAPGPYSVTVTNQLGCKGSATATINSATGPQVTLTKSDVKCFGGSDGSVTAAVTGGTGTLVYTWSVGTGSGTSQANLAAGDVTLTVSDAAACKTVKTITITQPSAPLTASITSQGNVCVDKNEGVAEVTANGGTIVYSYLWSNTGNTNPQTNLASGPISVTVTDANNCSTTATSTIAAATPISVVSLVTNATTSTTADGSVTLDATGGANPLSYNWTGGETTATISNLLPGNYDCTITDGNGCQKTQAVTVGFQTGIRDNNKVDVTVLEVYPNPVKGECFVKIELSSLQNVSVSIHNALGQKMEERKIGNIKVENLRLDVNSYPSGIYFIKVNIAGKPNTLRFIKN